MGGVYNRMTVTGIKTGDTHQKRCMSPYCIAVFIAFLAVNCYASNDGWNFLVSGKIDSANEFFERSIAKDPSDPDALEGLGLISYYRADFSGSFDNFSGLIKTHPDLIQSHVYLCRLLEMPYYSRNLKLCLAVCVL